VKQVVGERACPFDGLHRSFIARPGHRFGVNPRTAMPLQVLRKVRPERVAAFLAAPAMAAAA
jgi:deoxyribodipyrimidine photolyase-like uncharacterized protein